MMSIKNPEALHSLGRQRFRDVPAIANSASVEEMLAAMWGIVNENEPATREAKDLQLRVITFLSEHAIKQPRRRYTH